MTIIDFKKDFRELYSVPADRIEIVTVPELNYLMVDGCGAPGNSGHFNDAIDALFSLSHTIKLMYKNGVQKVDYGVMPLEGLWWTEDNNHLPAADKAAWKWTLMIMQPGFVTNKVVDKAKEQTDKKNSLPILNQLRLETIGEGLSAQILHVGPYDAGSPTIERLHSSIKDNGYQPKGKHQEIYLSDRRKTTPGKLKTIIRQAVI